MKKLELKGIKGAIFDIDGTILDSMTIWDQAGERFLKSLNIVAERDLGKTLFSKTIEQSAIYLKENYDLDMDIKSIIAGVNKQMLDFYKDEAMPKEGMVELLDQLKNSGIKMTVATSTDREIFMPAFKRLNLEKYFDCIYTCTEVGKSKGEPDIFYRAMEFMETNPEETWVFEDGLYAAKTAKSIGLKVVGVYDITSLHDWDELMSISDQVILFNV